MVKSLEFVSKLHQAGFICNFFFCFGQILSNFTCLQCIMKKALFVHCLRPLLITYLITLSLEKVWLRPQLFKRWIALSTGYISLQWISYPQLLRPEMLLGVHCVDFLFPLVLCKSSASKKSNDSLSSAGCKESQFNSLPFGQAVDSMYYSPQVISTSPKTLFDWQDWLQSFCSLNFPKKTAHAC